ncbi:hypothetical protein WCLP8_1560004 [uncultured Gammaproteobacteria bacterium]
MKARLATPGVIEQTDNELEIVESVPAEVVRPGSTTAPAHTLYDIVLVPVPPPKVELPPPAPAKPVPPPVEPKPKFISQAPASPPHQCF